VRGALRGNVGICEPQGGEAGGLIHPRCLLPGAHLLPCAASAKGRFACYHRGCRCCRGRRERVRGAHRAGNNSRDPARANGAGSSSVSLTPFLLFLAPSCPLSPRGRSEEIEILHLWRSAAHKNHRKSTPSPALLILIVAACIHNSNMAQVITSISDHLAGEAQHQERGAHVTTRVVRNSSCHTHRCRRAMTAGKSPFADPRASQLAGPLLRYRLERGIPPSFSVQGEASNSHPP